MHIKIHRSYRNIVAICDSNLLGKKFEEGKRQLDLRENFYKGELVEHHKALEIIKNQITEDATFNIVGQESINAAIEAELITQNQVDKIQSIPFTLTLL